VRLALALELRRFERCRFVIIIINNYNYERRRIRKLSRTWPLSLTLSLSLSFSLSPEIIIADDRLVSVRGISATTAAAFRSPNRGRAPACKKIQARCDAEKEADLNYSTLRKGRRLSETQDVLKLRCLFGQMAPIAAADFMAGAHRLISCTVLTSCNAREYRTCIVAIAI